MSASKFDSFPEYKSAKLAWIDKIPKQWEIKKIKYISTVENSGAFGLEPGEAEFDLPVCTTAQISTNSVFNVTKMPVRSFSSKEKKFYLGRIGDIFVVKSSGSNTNIISGKLGQIKHDTPEIIFSNFLMRIRPKKDLVHPQFLAYFLSSELTKQRIKRMVATTTYPNINVPKYVDSTISLPPLNEQPIITHFILNVDSYTTSLVEQLEKQVHLIKEKRSALITQAVTKGLNPDVAMRDSGIDYIGLIPEHWTVGQISKLFDIKAGGDLDREHFSHKKDQLHKFPIYTNATDENSIYGFTSKPKFNSNTITVSGRGDVGYAIYRDHAYDAIIRLLVLEPRKNYNCMFFKSCISEIIDFKVGSSAINQLSTTQISPYYVPIPPTDEQNEIAEFLSKKINLTLQNVKKIEEQIITLNEYRNALISAAVTGKIDVRGQA